MTASYEVMMYIENFLQELGAVIVLACLWRVRERYLCYRAGRFLMGCIIPDECTALQLMFVSNTALTLTLLLCLYDMGMFPKLHSVWQYPC